MEKETTLNDYKECVNEVTDYINRHLSGEIDLRQLATVSHFSPFHFHRIMRAFLGEPIGTLSYGSVPSLPPNCCATPICRCRR